MFLVSPTSNRPLGLRPHGLFEVTRPEMHINKSDNTRLNHALIVLLCCMLSLKRYVLKISSNILNGKENLEDYPPPAKKRRLSLSLRKKKTSPLQDCAVNVSKFANPVSQEEMEVAAQGVVPDNTKCNNKWAANNFTELLE